MQLLILQNLSVSVNCLNLNSIDSRVFSEKVSCLFKISAQQLTLNFNKIELLKKMLMLLR